MNTIHAMRSGVNNPGSRIFYVDRDLIESAIESYLTADLLSALVTSWSAVSCPTCHTPAGVVCETRHGACPSRQVLGFETLHALMRDAWGVAA